MRPTIVWCLLIFGACLQLKLHVCSKFCRDGNYYTVTWSNGSFKNCLKCDTCHPGYGLDPPCGGQITSPVKGVGCKPCVDDTFSDELDSAPCHPCQSCAEHEIVTANCNSTSNRICSGTCIQGYYFSKKPLHNCQKCSYCCLDGKDDIQQECVNQGLNVTNQHCSPRVDRRCGPDPTTMIIPKTHDQPPQRTDTTAETSANHHNQPSNQGHSKFKIISIVLGMLAGVFLAALVGGVYLFRRRKSQTTTGGLHPRASYIETARNLGELSESQAPVNQGGQVRVPQAVAHSPIVQALQNEGFLSTSNPTTPQVSPKGTPCHTDDEIEDLPDVTVRTKHLWKRQNSKETRSVSTDKANEGLLADPNVQPSTSASGSVQSEIDGDAQQGSKGAEGGHRRRRSSSGSLQSVMRKLSLTGKDDYQPLAVEDPDEPSEPLRIAEHPSNQEHKEGSRVEFKCKVHGKKKVIYQWLKDGTEIQGQNGSSLVLDPVKLRDFGCYACRVRGTGGSDCMESSPATLDVTPRDRTRYKYLSEVFQHSLETQEKVEKLLVKKIPGLGGWKHVAFKYKMDELDISSLEGNPEAGKSIIEYLRANNTELTVYEFCKTLKESNIRRLDIVNQLLGHLSAPMKQTTVHSSEFFGRIA